MSFSSAEHQGKRRITSQQRLLAEMDKVVPWQQLVGLIESHYPAREGLHKAAADGPCAPACLIARLRRSCGFSDLSRLHCEPFCARRAPVRPLQAHSSPRSLQRVARHPKVGHGTTVRILMLDFDGVLHSSQGNQIEDFALAPMLADALDARACSVVITSTWREHYSLSALKGLLPGRIPPASE